MDGVCRLCFKFLLRFCFFLLLFVLKFVFVHNVLRSKKPQYYYRQPFFLNVEKHAWNSIEHDIGLCCRSRNGRCKWNLIYFQHIFTKRHKTLIMSLSNQMALLNNFHLSRELERKQIKIDSFKTLYIRDWLIEYHDIEKWHKNVVLKRSNKFEPCKIQELQAMIRVFQKRGR